MNLSKTVFLILVSNVIICSSSLAQSTAPEEGSCEATIETHAFLSRGQFQCNFRSYGGGMMEAARDCGSKMSKDDLDHWLNSGMKLFDYNESKKGHAAMCKSLLVDFPKILRK